MAEHICDNLFEASIHIHNECLKTLLDRGENVNQKTFNRWTPLHLASRNAKFDDDVTSIELLLNNGANIYEKNDNGETALHCIIANFSDISVIITRILLNSNTNISSCINNENNRGETSLFLAVRLSNRHDMVTSDENIFDEKIKILLNYGADPHHQNSEGQTAYDIARDDLKKLFDEHFEPVKEPEKE
jgi:ankyrin repeat protein